MNHLPGFLNIEDYTYELPHGRIARFPLEERDSSKLLIYREGKITNGLFRELPDILPLDSHLVFNDTRVIQARLAFRKSTGSAVEIFLLEPREPSEYNLSFGTKKGCTWNCLIGNSKKWKSGILEKKMNIRSRTITLQAQRNPDSSSSRDIRFTWSDPELTFSEIIQNAGQTPIPPYLERLADISDIGHYQTVYSREEGSVAAPTAGLHFTHGLLNELNARGIPQTRLTLHVGAGTFIPVREQNAIQHEMHTEHIYLSMKSLQELKNSTKKIIAVGTTSIRTLESVYHLAERIENGKIQGHKLYLDQWDAYKYPCLLGRADAYGILLDYMKKQKMENLKISTRIMIIPGYEFKMTDGIITNFHQPGSTLLLLIGAFTGENWRKIYDHALKDNYRFLSYGDSSLLL